jgi:hypothetical protein
MYDLSKPIPNDVIVGSIVFILIVVSIGLLVIEYYKRKSYK